MLKVFEVKYSAGEVHLNWHIKHLDITACCIQSQECMLKNSHQPPSSVISLRVKPASLQISCYLVCVVLLSCWWRSRTRWQWALIWFQFWFGPVLVLTDAELERAAVWERKHDKGQIKWLDVRRKQFSHYLSPERMANWWHREASTASTIYQQCSYLLWAAAFGIRWVVFSKPFFKITSMFISILLWWVHS